MGLPGRMAAWGFAPSQPPRRRCLRQPRGFLSLHAVCGPQRVAGIEVQGPRSEQNFSATMLVPKKNRLEVYKYLFKGARCRGEPFSLRRGATRGERRHVGKLRRCSPTALGALNAPRPLCAEGVCFAEKDFNLPQHPEIPVPNLHVRSYRHPPRPRLFPPESCSTMDCSPRTYDLVLSRVCVLILGADVATKYEQSQFCTRTSGILGGTLLAMCVAPVFTSRAWPFPVYWYNFVPRRRPLCTGDQADAELQVQGVRQGGFRVAPLLLARRHALLWTAALRPGTASLCPPALCAAAHGPKCCAGAGT